MNSHLSSPRNGMVFSQLNRHHKRADTSKELRWNTNTQLHPVKLQGQAQFKILIYNQPLYRRDLNGFRFLYPLASHTMLENRQTVPWLI